MIFSSPWVPEFADHGVGAMAWEIFNEGSERLIIVVPHATREVYPIHAPNNWAQPGPVNGRDGNRDHPTFSPSIDCSCGGKHPGGWHGYIVAGRVCGTNKKPID